jgi:transcriptional regulator GlxA family with amidase domain
VLNYLKRPGGQAQFSTVLTLQAGDGRFDRLHAWIRENLSAPRSSSTRARARSIPAVTPAEVQTAPSRTKIGSGYHALAVARQLVVYLKRPGGQAQFSTVLTLQAGDGLR